MHVEDCELFTVITLGRVIQICKTAVWWKHCSHSAFNCSAALTSCNKGSWRHFLSKETLATDRNEQIFMCETHVICKAAMARILAYAHIRRRAKAEPARCRFPSGNATRLQSVLACCLTCMLVARQAGGCLLAHWWRSRVPVFDVPRLVPAQQNLLSNPARLRKLRNFVRNRR